MINPFKNMCAHMLTYTYFLTTWPSLTGLLAITPSAGSFALWFLLLGCLAIGFALTGAEVALFSLSWSDLDRLKVRRQPVARKVVRMLKSPRTLLASLSVARILLYLLIVVISDLVLFPVFSSLGVHLLFSLVLRIIIISSFILLICEFLPRQWAQYRKMHFIHFTSFVLEPVHLIFLPLAGFAIRFSDRVMQLFGSGKGRDKGRDRLDHAIDRSSDPQATEAERNIVKGVIRFGNTTVRQIMRSRVDVHGIDRSTPFPDLLRSVAELRYSRLPVFRGNLDRIEGVIHTKDLLPMLHAPADTDWLPLMRPAYYVPEHKLIEDLLQEFRVRRIHFAVVVDEFGGTEGIVTLEDILEEVIGDIRDEFDEDEVRHVRLDDQTFIFEGGTLITEACDFMGLDPAIFSSLQGDHETMAGLLLELAGEIPAAGTEIRKDGFLFTAIDVAQHRILRVKVHCAPPHIQQHA